MTTVDIQFSPANTDWATLRRAAIEAESRGYGAVHVFDHLAGLPLEGSSMIETFTLLGAFAASTERIELGTMVANAWNRQAGTVVAAIASVTAIAQRQVWFGVGAGSAPGTSWAIEHDTVGATPPADLSARHERVGHVLDLCGQQWNSGRSERFATYPLPSPRPRVIVGANSVRLSRLAAARADGICLQWLHPRRDVFLEAVAEAVEDRPFTRVAYTTYSPALLAPDHPMRREMADHGVDRLVLAVFDDLTSWFADEVGPV